MPPARSSYTLAILLIPLLVYTAIPTHGFTSGYAHSRDGFTQRPDCDPLIEAIKQEPDWLDRLYDPVLTTEQEIRQLSERYRPLFNCLSDKSELLSPEEQLIYRLTAYYLIFADGLFTPQGDSTSDSSSGSTFQLVDLQTVDDPAIRQLREDTGIPPPAGYVFVRTYDSIASMPAPIRAIFEQDSVAGVTILSRYIAILDEGGANWAEQALSAQTLPRTVSHELVHAYVNAVLGSANISQLPTWYHEGIAIYFSRSGESHAVVTPNFRLYTTSPPEYRQYELNFQFLEHLLGTDGLRVIIGKSITAADESMILEAAGIESGDELALQALSWQSARLRSRLTIGLVVISIIAVLVFSGQLRNIGVILPVVRCAVCGRLYWVWRSDQVQDYRPAVRIWQGQVSDDDQPYSVFARRVCTTCVNESKHIHHEYQQKMRDQIEGQRQIATNTYHAYLADAPVYESSETIEAGTLDIHQMVSYLVDVALASRYAPPWFEAENDDQFVMAAYDPEFDPIHTPPGGYSNVLVKSELVDGREYPAFGSIFKSQGGGYRILWRLQPGTNHATTKDNRINYS